MRPPPLTVRSRASSTGEWSEDEERDELLHRAQALLRPEGTDSWDAVCISDLHFTIPGCHAYFPPESLEPTLAAIKTLVATARPKQLLILGDLFHGAVQIPHAFDADEAPPTGDEPLTSLQLVETVFRHLNGLGVPLMELRARWGAAYPHVHRYNADLLMLTAGAQPPREGSVHPRASPSPPEHEGGFSDGAVAGAAGGEASPPRTPEGEPRSAAQFQGAPERFCFVTHDAAHPVWVSHHPQSVDRFLRGNRRFLRSLIPEGSYLVAGHVHMMRHHPAEGLASTGCFNSHSEETFDPLTYVRIREEPAPGPEGARFVVMAHRRDGAPYATPPEQAVEFESTLRRPSAISSPAP
ncbi:hypothetical protein PAPYR_7327 [Paratrimastix pyriformis]|uniref:Calcineurin-like phosphoesterase domain-containing protein n=1 Tax=Paratrimastix pyriformis TaxID=342808 RepID=A0ABQ8UES6_9EUKA|nr:hypothetical protein PAPYR_7327 [Paratrimastix pyriformis]